MNKLLACLTVLALGLSLAAQSHAGYWQSADGGVWHSGAGECVHTGYWTPEMAIVGCDGKTADVPTPAAAAPAAPKPAPVAMTAANLAVNFAFDRADLDAEATAALESLVQKAKGSGSIRSARVTGHADRVGTEEYNLDLSLRRASAVSDYLVQRGGLDPQSIEIAGKGESQPLVACEGAFGAAALKCLAPNRRVEVILELLSR